MPFAILFARKPPIKMMATYVLTFPVWMTPFEITTRAHSSKTLPTWSRRAVQNPRAKARASLVRTLREFDVQQRSFGWCYFWKGFFFLNGIENPLKWRKMDPLPKGWRELESGSGGGVRGVKQWQSFLQMVYIFDVYFFFCFEFPLLPANLMTFNLFLMGRWL